MIHIVIIVGKKPYNPPKQQLFSWFWGIMID